MKSATLIGALILAVTLNQPAKAEGLRTDHIIFGLAAATILGLHFHSKNDREDHAVNTHQPRPDPIVRPRPPKFPKTVPAHCKRRVRTIDGPVRIFARACLKRNDINLRKLPKHCKIRVEARNGNIRRGYRPRCLRRAGYVWS